MTNPLLPPDPSSLLVTDVQGFVRPEPQRSDFLGGTSLTAATTIPEFAGSGTVRGGMLGARLLGAERPPPRWRRGQDEPEREPSEATAATYTGVVMGSNRLPDTIVPVTNAELAAAGGRLSQLVDRHFEPAASPLETPDLHGWYASESAGGLAVAMRQARDRMQGVWVGWPGVVSDVLSPLDQERITAYLTDRDLSPVFLSKADKTGFYDLTSNGWLWLGMHGLGPLMSMTADWDLYVDVNRRFADAIVNAYKPGQVIWIHDYQLMLVPQMVREMLPDATIGFFLHIPFPPRTTFFNIPHSAEVLEGLLGADYISFQTASYRTNFLDSIWDPKLRPIKVRYNEGLLMWKGRLIGAGHDPISISRAEIESLAKDPRVLAKAQALREEWTKHRVQPDGSVLDTDVIVAVDRLDPTKGLLHKLTAFQALLREYKALGKDPESLKLVHVTPSTREDLPIYEELHSKVDLLVQQIIDEFGPNVIDFHYRKVDLADVIAHYLASEILLCTPLGDGMNLTPKEAVVTWATAMAAHLKIRRKPGVIVLSRQAGASEELVEAITVNAFHPVGRTYTPDTLQNDAWAGSPTGDILWGLRKALVMPVSEQRRTLENLNDRIRDISAWRDDYIASTLRMGELSRKERKVSRDREVAAAVDKIQEWTGKRVFVVHYDALMQYADSPRQTVNDPVLHALLANLAAGADDEVHVVSGGSKEQLLRSGLGDLKVGLHAEHALWSRMPGRDYWIQRESNKEWMEAVRGIFDGYEGRIPGSFVEGVEDGKHNTIAFHYRGQPDRNYEKMKAELEAILDHTLVDILEGDHVIEVRPAMVTQGLTLRAVNNNTPSDDSTLTVVFANPASDDDLGEVGKNTMVIGVGTQTRRADVWLADTDEARDFLRDVITEGPPEAPRFPHRRRKLGEP